MELRSIFNVFRPTETRATSWDSVDALDVLGARGTQKAGQTVTPDSAMSVSAYYAGVRIISEGLASLPALAYQEENDIPQPMPNPPEWLDIANPGLGLTFQDVRAQALVSLLMRGNAYILIFRVGLAVIGMEVLDPDSVEPIRKDGRIAYRVGDKVYSAFELLHIRGMTLPGEIEGMDPITYAAASLGIGIAAQEYGAAYMANASLPSGFIKVPGTLSEVAAKLIRRGWDRLHSGSANAGRVAVLTEGSEFVPLSLTPEQTQFLEVRRFTVQDVARILGVPPHLLADSSNSTSWGSGLAEQNTAFSKMTLTPLAERLDRAFTHLLRSESAEGRKAFKVRTRLEGFERGSYRERIETYGIGITAGIYTPDEVRAWEELGPLSGDTPETEGRSLTAAEIIQKVYLGVGTMLTADEARALANAAGANLPPGFELPEPPAADPDPDPDPDPAPAGDDA